jgi:hypothetical protein
MVDVETVKVYRLQEPMSSPTTYRPPLIRQVLPWLFVLVFLVTAPLLIFYTSGYRYNFKKGIVERNGTLIVDSIPDGGVVFIDDRASGEKTPVTLQNMVPGWHNLRVERPGYSSWHENVLIRSERVTFANHILLWPEATPVLAHSGNVFGLNADPYRDHALLLQKAESTWQWQLWTPTGSSDPAILANASPSSTFVTQWSSDGQAALLEDIHSQTHWWIHRVNGKDLAEVLPTGNYHWSENELIGNTEKTTLRVATGRTSLISTAHKTGVIQQSQGLELQLPASSTDREILVDDSFLTRRFALPIGNWSFGNVIRPFVLLQDRERWLAIEMKFGQPYAETVRGDYPRFAPNQDIPRTVFLNGNELWLWKLGESPSLLWRQSEPLTQVTWHRSGSAVFVADQTRVFTLNIDEGVNPTAIPLATFDQIQDLTVIGRILYVAGTRNGITGIWELRVE